MIRPLLATALFFLLCGCSAQPPQANTPALTAVGIAPISIQPGATPAERMRQAMVAAKLDAFSELAEQLSGREIRGEWYSQSGQLQQEVVYSQISAQIQGARVVRSYAEGDHYVTELALDTITPVVEVVPQRQYY